MIQTLDQIALKHGTDKASNFHDYCRYYETYFASLRYSPLTLLEVGVQFGPSIKTWLDYFLQAKIIGVDLERQDSIDDPRYTFIMRDAKLVEIDELLDIVIDDGSHMPGDYIGTFNNLWPKVVPGGYYIIEDIFTSYHPQFSFNGAGVNWFNELAACVHQHGKAFYGSPDPVIAVDSLTPLERQLEFIHFYKGLAIMKKRIGEPNLK